MNGLLSVSALPGPWQLAADRSPPSGGGEVLGAHRVDHRGSLPGAVEVASTEGGEKK